MSTSSKTAGKNEAKQTTSAKKADAAPKGVVFDFDAAIAQHTEDEEGFTIEIFDDDNTPFRRPDGSQAVAVMLGSTSDEYRAALLENEAYLDEVRDSLKQPDGTLRELTKKERDDIWVTLLRRKYTAVLKSIDLYRGNELIELTPENRKRLFEVKPHLVDLFYAAEVRRRETFRAGAQGAGGPGGVARRDGEASDGRSNHQGQSPAPADNEAGDG